MTCNQCLFYNLKKSKNCPVDQYDYPCDGETMFLDKSEWKSQPLKLRTIRDYSKDIAYYE
jgi:hypothetical protein